MRKPVKKIWIVILSLIVLLIAFRLYLPTLVLNYVNQKINAMPDYGGGVYDIDIHLIRGAYEMDSVVLHKKNGKIPVPFFEARKIDFSVEWEALFKGSIAGEIEFYTPKINLVTAPSEELSQTRADSSWIDLIDQFMPLKINRVAVINGEVHYLDFHSKPKIDITMSNVQVIARNLKNTEDYNDPLPASLIGQANVYEGNIDMEMKLNPLAKKPTFDMNLKAENINLVRLNDYLKANANFDVKKGNFNLYTEIVSKEGKYSGYVKPIIKDLDILQLDKEEGGLFQKLYESVIAGAGLLLENQSKDQVATKTKISGDFDNPQFAIVPAVVNLVKNAFIKALSPSLENSVGIGSISSEMKEDDEKEKKEELKKAEKEKKKNKK